MSKKHAEKADSGDSWAEKVEADKPSGEPMPDAALKKFPAEFPQSSLATLIDALEGKPVDLRSKVEAAYDLVGFGLGVVFTTEPPNLPAPVTLGTAADNEQLLKRLREVRDGVGVSAPDWSKIINLLPLLLQLLQQWMRS